MVESTLLDVAANLGSLDAELTIYAVEPWTCESRAVVAREPDAGGVPSEAASIGATYFLEIDVANEVMEDVYAEAGGPASRRAWCERLIQYAINDC